MVLQRVSERIRHIKLRLCPLTVTNLTTPSFQHHRLYLIKPTLCPSPLLKMRVSVLFAFLPVLALAAPTPSMFIAPKTNKTLGG